MKPFLLNAWCVASWGAEVRETSLRLVCCRGLGVQFGYDHHVVFVHDHNIARVHEGAGAKAIEMIRDIVRQKFAPAVS
jgi:threonine dehydratase